MLKVMQKFRLLFLKVARPITIWIGNRHMPYSRKKLNGLHLMTIQDRVTVGMIFTTYTGGELSNPLIPGEWKHAAIYVGGGVVVEALGKGVVESYLPEFVLRKDKIAMYSPKFCDETCMQKAANFAKSKIGLPYDYEFMSNNKAFYCSELLYAAYNEAMNGKSPFTPRMTLGVETIVPQDIANAKDKWDCVFIKR